MTKVTTNKGWEGERTSVVPDSLGPTDSGSGIGTRRTNLSPGMCSALTVNTVTGIPTITQEWCATLDLFGQA